MSGDQGGNCSRRDKGWNSVVAQLFETMGFGGRCRRCSRGRKGQRLFLNLLYVVCNATRRGREVMDRLGGGGRE